MKTNNQRGKCAIDIDVTKNEKYCIQFDISLTTTCSYHRVLDVKRPGSKPSKMTFTHIPTLQQIVT